MSDEPVIPPAPAPDPALQVAATDAVAKAEAAATRRRWINLGEFVAVAGLIVGGIGLWLNWSDHRSDLAEKQAEKTVAAQQSARYEIVGSVDRHGDIQILRDPRHALGDVTVIFPSALDLGTKTSPYQSIARHWYEAALLKATDGGPDTRTGTLPVLLTVQYFDDDTPMVARGMFDIVWKTDGRFLLGRTLHVVGFKRRGRAGGQAALDAAWAAENPKP